MVVITQLMRQCPSWPEETILMLILSTFKRTTTTQFLPPIAIDHPTSSAVTPSC